jgi:carbon storage regulator
MLIISRKKHEKLVIADDVEITILEVGRNRVRFGVKAPKHVAIQTHLKTDALTAEGGSQQQAPPPASLPNYPVAVSTSKRR